MLSDPVMLTTRVMLSDPVTMTPPVMLSGVEAFL